MSRPGLLVAIPLLLLAQGRAQVAAGGASPRELEAREIDALKERILELEKELGAVQAAAKATTLQPAGTTRVSTMAAREAGLKAKAGAGDAAAVKALLTLFERRQAPALAKELGALLARGEAAQPTLYDFLSELDRDSRQALLLSYDYHFSFSLVHLAMLHPDELARLAHYFLAASQASPRSALRRTLFDFLPDFLRYHSGRYPELERDLEAEILERLRDGKGDLQMYFRTMEALAYKPPIEVFDPLLERASSHAETLPVALHLEARNTPEAVEILSENIARNPPGIEWKAAIMLGALARMSAPEAAKVLWDYIYSPDQSLAGAALQAYLSAPHDRSALPLLQEFLNSGVDMAQKRHLVLRLPRGNPELLDALKAEIGKLRSEEVRALLSSEDLQGARQPAR